MQLRIKTTGFKLTEGIRLLAEEKILLPIQKRLSRELPPEHVLDIELAKTTNHHEEGKIWKCEANIALPQRQRTVYAVALAESLEAAIDDAKYEVEREIIDYKQKKSSRFLKMARGLKDSTHVTRLARMPGELYRWIRRK